MEGEADTRPSPATHSPRIYIGDVTISTCAAHASARPHVREDNARARFVLFTTSLVREHEIFLTHSKQRQHYIARSNSQPRYIVCVCNRRNQGMHPISLPIHASARVVSYFVSVRQSMAFCSSSYDVQYESSFQQTSSSTRFPSGLHSVFTNSAV